MKIAVILHFYPSAQGKCEGRVYSDAGDGYGDWRLDCFRLRKAGDSFELSWEHQGDFPFPYKGFQLHFHGVEIEKLRANGREIDVRGNYLELDSL